MQSMLDDLAVYYGLPCCCQRAVRLPTIAVLPQIALHWLRSARTGIGTSSSIVWQTLLPRRGGRKILHLLHPLKMRFSKKNYEVVGREKHRGTRRTNLDELGVRLSALLWSLARLRLVNYLPGVSPRHYQRPQRRFPLHGFPPAAVSPILFLLLARLGTPIIYDRAVFPSPPPLFFSNLTFAFFMPFWKSCRNLVASSFAAAKHRKGSPVYSKISGKRLKNTLQPFPPIRYLKPRSRLLPPPNLIFLDNSTL